MSNSDKLCSSLKTGGSGLKRMNKKSRTDLDVIVRSFRRSGGFEHTSILFTM